MFDFLARSSSLWTTFVATILMTIAFGIVMMVWDFSIIDEMSNPEKILEHVAAMSPVQRFVHAWMTATLDVAYPFAYGGLFIGMSARFLGKAGPWLAVPAMLVIPVDLTEGLVQVLVLNGYESVVWMKQYVTPAKLVLYFAAMLTAVFALGVGILRKLRTS